MNDENNEEGGFLDRIKESPRTVSALIIILIVAAAIYAFSGDQDDQLENTGDLAVIGEEELEGNAEDGEEADEAIEAGETAGATTSTPAPTPQEVSKKELVEQSLELPEATKDTEGYTEIAQAGDGITHLARRASTRWLSENQVDFAVTNEHRIYIEDYIQNRIGSEGLGLGETRTIPFGLVEEAVMAASQLNESQLQNLTQYSQVL